MWVFLLVSSLSKKFEVTVEGKGKTGEISVCLDGLNVNMSRFPKKSASRASTSNGKCKVFGKTSTN